MFDNMLSPDTSKGQTTPSEHDMVAEGCLMIAAGTDTTANALGNATWYIMSNPAIYERLFAELQAAMPDINDVVDSGVIEGDQFIYLRAVVKETLRLSFGVPGKMARRIPEGGAILCGQFIPHGVCLPNYAPT